MTRFILLFLFFLLYLEPCSAVATNQFRNWYPEFALVFDSILHNNCSAQYDRYLTGKKVLLEEDRFTGAGHTSSIAQPVVNCILELTSEYIKSNMASAGVVLGIAPSILAALGSSTEETSILFVLAQRPFLAMLLTVGSPAVHPFRTFQHSDPLGLLREREGRLSPPKLFAGSEILVSFFEYVLSAGSVANIVTLGVELGIRAPCTFALHLTYLPLLWGILGAVGHLTGAMALRCRARLTNKSTSNMVSVSWIKFQLGLESTQRSSLGVDLVKETSFYNFLTFFTSIYTSCHVVWGTLVFSSILFISVRDSIMVIGRLMVSVICCRVILMYELAKLREQFNSGKKLPGEDPERTSVGPFLDGTDVELRRMVGTP